MTIRRLAILAALALASPLALAACGGGQHSGGAVEHAEEAFIEGLSEELEGVDYDVYLTRQLNLQDVEDSGYTDLDAPPPGSTYYASFMEVCNRSEETQTTAEEMYVEDSQGEIFEPVDISDSEFAYESAVLEPGGCIPEVGSLAQMGPAGGALVVFEFPLEATENRPLVLHIVGTEPGESGEPDELEIVLDL